MQFARNILRGLFTSVLLIATASFGQLVYNPGGGGGGGTGTVTSIATTGPISGGTITSTGTISCPTCTTNASALTSTAIMTGGGGQASQTPSATSTLSAAGNMVLAGTLNATGASTGTAPVACGTAAGCYAATEGTAANMTITASQDAFAADATAHAFKMTLNGGAIFLSAMNLIQPASGTIAAAFASAPAGSKCLHTNGVTGAITEAAADCGTGAVASVNTLTGAVVIEAATSGQMAVSGGSGAALTGAADMTYTTHTFATITTGIFDWSAATGTNSFKLPAVVGGTFLAGTSTANLSAPIVIQNTNSSNNNTSITMGITGPGTSTGQTILNINGATTGGDLLDIGTGGTWTNGVLSGQTKQFAVDAGGSFYESTYTGNTTTGSITVTPAKGAFQTITLSGNLTIAFTQPAFGSTVLKLKITQAAGANDTVTWTSVKWPGGIAPVMTAAANAVDWYSCVLDGTNTYCTTGQNFQ